MVSSIYMTEHSQRVRHSNEKKYLVLSAILNQSNKVQRAAYWSQWKEKCLTLPLLSFFLSICLHFSFLPVCLCLSVCLSFFLTLSVFFPSFLVCLSVSQSVYLSIYLSIYLHSFFHLFTIFFKFAQFFFLSHFLFYFVFQNALKEFVSSADAVYGKKHDEFFIGFEGR